MTSKRSIEERIEARLEEKRQLEAQIKQLMQQQRTQERKERTHRLCKRGGLVEKHLPDLIKLTDEQFQVFINKCLLTNFTMKTLSELVALNDNTETKSEMKSQHSNDDTASESVTTSEIIQSKKFPNTAA